MYTNDKVENVCTNYQVENVYTNYKAENVYTNYKVENVCKNFKVENVCTPVRLYIGRASPANTVLVAIVPVHTVEIHTVPLELHTDAALHSARLGGRGSRRTGVLKKVRITQQSGCASWCSILTLL